MQLSFIFRNSVLVIQLTAFDINNIAIECCNSGTNRTVRILCIITLQKIQ